MCAWHGMGYNLVVKAHYRLSSRNYSLIGRVSIEVKFEGNLEAKSQTDEQKLYIRLI